MPKVAVVTGGNKGIGYEIVRGLCKQFDGDVILTARDESRGKDAVGTLKAAGLKPIFHQLEIDSESSVANMKRFLETNYGGLDVLVNNAAIAYLKELTVPIQEQAQNTLRINFYSTKNVCDAFFPLLRPHARVVNLSSSAGKVSRIGNEEIRTEFENPNLTVEQLYAIVSRYAEDVKLGRHDNKGWAPTPYSMSKIALTKLTFIQQKQFDQDEREDIIVNAVHPGLVTTDMTNHQGTLTPTEGATAPLYCALLPPNVKSPKGQFVWYDCSVMSWR